MGGEEEGGGGGGRVKGIMELMRENRALCGLQEKIDAIHVPEGEVDILLMKRYYGDHIRAHPNDLEGMKKVVWAQYYHSISTDEDPQHQYCPEGAESWCKYNQALALHQALPSHVPAIPADLQQYIKPVFDDLCKEGLLEKCLLGATQNQNECFNSLVWARAPKIEYVGRPTIEITVSHSVLVFNSGRQAMVEPMKRQGIVAGPVCNAHLRSQDAKCVKRAQIRESVAFKRHRKLKQIKRISVEEARIEAEGTTYEAGAF